MTQHSLQQQYYTKKKDGFESYYSSIMLPHNFYGAPRRLMAKNEYIVAHASNPIIYKGRKGHIEVIKAISIANKNGYNVRVKFAGGGDNASLESLCALAKTLGIEDKVEFVGFLSKEELRQMLLEADLFVMPTRAEGLPRVIIEAMAVGLPCISTNVSGNSELLQPEFLLDNYSDIQLLSQKIIALLTDADLYAETSKHNFTISQQYEQLILQKRRDLFYSKLKEISQA